ncbi:MAG: radical SAM protein [Ruminococcus sp.]|nr:radical SAM protein [Ruminococcus sp.]
MMAKITIKPNSNFESLAGNNQPENASEEYLKYREAWMQYPKQFYLRELPLHLDIEASSLCNLRCTFCDKLPLLQKNQLGNLSFDTFKKVMDQFSEDPDERLWGLKLSYRGEPLINKDVPRMVKYAKERGVLDIYFNTNGMLLTEDVSRKLIQAHLDRISISIDGTNTEEYEAVRVGAKLDTVLANIQTLRRLKEEYHVTYPKIRIQTVKLPELDLDKYVNTWKEYADEVAAIDFKDESCRNTELRGDWACPQLWQRMTIEWDGTIFGCNNDDMRGLCLGNVNERSIYDCWHDEKLMQTRKLHMEGKSHEIEDCNGCPWRTAQIKKS